MALHDGTTFWWALERLTAMEAGIGPLKSGMGRLVMVDAGTGMLDLLRAERIRCDVECFCYQISG